MNDQIKTRLLEGVTLYDPAVKEQVEWDADSGFLVDTTTAVGGLLRIVGFASPFLPGGHYKVPVPDPRRRVHPVTDFNHLPQTLSTTKHVSKGVAWPRIYTDAGSARVGSDVPTPDGSVGLWAVTMERDRFKDGRSDAGGKVAQIVHHLVQVAEGTVFGAEAVADRVHRQYERQYGDDIAALQRNLPPSGQLALRREGGQPPEGVEAGFVLPLDPELAIVKLGECGIAES